MSKLKELLDTLYRLYRGGEHGRLRPSVLGIARRNDIRFTGSQPTALSTSGMDLTLVSMTSLES